MDFKDPKVVAAKWNTQRFNLDFKGKHCLDQFVFSIRFDDSFSSSSYVAIKGLTFELTLTNGSGDFLMMVHCTKSNCTPMSLMLKQDH